MVSDISRLSPSTLTTQDALILCDKYGDAWGTSDFNVSGTTPTHERIGRIIRSRCDTAIEGINGEVQCDAHIAGEITPPLTSLVDVRTRVQNIAPRSSWIRLDGDSEMSLSFHLKTKWSHLSSLLAKPTSRKTALKERLGNPDVRIVLPDRSEYYGQRTGDRKVTYFSLGEKPDWRLCDALSVRVVATTETESVNQHHSKRRLRSSAAIRKKQVTQKQSPKEINVMLLKQITGLEESLARSQAESAALSEALEHAKTQAEHERQEKKISRDSEKCNAANLAACNIIELVEEKGIEHFGAEAWAARPDEDRVVSDYLCGNHSRNLPWDEFERRFTEMMQGDLGDAFAACSTASGLHARLEKSGKALLRSICKLGTTGFGAYEKGDGENTATYCH